MIDLRKVIEARRWFRRLGHMPVEYGTVSAVVTPEFPAVWDGNFVMAGPGATSQDLFAALDRAFARAPWRVVVADGLTPPEVEAALPLAGFAQQGQTVEMLAQGPLASPHPPARIELRAVDDAACRAALDDLVRADHREGDRTSAADASVGAGLLALMHRRAPPCTHWLLSEGSEAVGYGSTVDCPNGLGLIEDLFTRSDRRRRGLMSTFLLAAAERLRDAGCDGVFLGALADAAPQRLHAALGFQPVSLTRTWCGG